MEEFDLDFELQRERERKRKLVRAEDCDAVSRELAGRIQRLETDMLLLKREFQRLKMKP